MLLIGGLVVLIGVLFGLIMWAAETPAAYDEMVARRIRRDSDLRAKAASFYAHHGRDATPAELWFLSPPE